MFLENDVHESHAWVVLSESIELIVQGEGRKVELQI